MTALMCAATGKSADAVTLLLKQNADRAYVDAQESNGNTALHYGRALGAGLKAYTGRRLSLSAAEHSHLSRFRPSRQRKLKRISSIVPLYSL